LIDSLNTLLEHTIKMGHPQCMSSKQANCRHVLARFVEKIPINKGWWYRLPSGVALSNDNQPLPTDAILPHLGYAFGLTELAMWAILVEMGCISQNSRSKTWGINNEGWEFLSAEFSVSKNIQVSPTNLRENGRRVHYIRMGFPVQDNPTVIWNEYKKKKIKFPPTTITSRVALKFVAVELLQILKGSNMFFKILQSYTGVNITELRGLDATLLSTSERNNRVVAQLLDNSDDETDTIDKDSDGIEENEEEGDGNQEEEAAPESVAALLSAQPDITVGEVADRNEFPMMHRLNVSINSQLKIIELHKELLQYLQKTQPEDGTRLTSSFCYDVNDQ
jgi:hypothetical protein